MSMCPNCKKEELNYLPWLGQIWNCRNCGYRGVLAVELTERALQQLLRKIPRGKVTTYKELAKQLKVHSRTIAGLLAKNPHPKKYPCYKVVHSDGRIGGYSGKEGVGGKIRKLRKDGIIVENDKIDLKKYGFWF